jgi:hypothetical protein
MKDRIYGEINGIKMIAKLELKTFIILTILGYDDEFIWIYMNIFNLVDYQILDIV